MKRKVKLQNIKFPSISMYEHWEMFYHGKILIKDHINKNFIFPEKYDQCDFATSLNSFPYQEWKNNTNIENLNLELILDGKFNVTLTAFQKENERIKKYFLLEQTVIAKKDDPFNLHFPVSDKNYTIVAFELKALSKNCELFSGYYYSDIEESLICNISIPLIATTSKKEQFIIPNIETSYSDECAAKDFYIHIIDGTTLNLQNCGTEHLTCRHFALLQDKKII